MILCGTCGRPQFNKGAKPNETCLRCLKAKFNRTIRVANHLFITEMRALGFSQGDIDEELARRAEHCIR